jgi:hypothetical protein
MQPATEVEGQHQQGLAVVGRQAQPGREPRTRDAAARGRATQQHIQSSQLLLARLSVCTTIAAFFSLVEV